MSSQVNLCFVALDLLGCGAELTYVWGMLVLAEPLAMLADVCPMSSQGRRFRLNEMDDAAECFVSAGSKPDYFRRACLSLGPSSTHG